MRPQKVDDKSLLIGLMSVLSSKGYDGSVLVELKGEKIISKGYGFINKEKLIKNTPTTIFDIGSITNNLLLLQFSN